MTTRLSLSVLLGVALGAPPSARAEEPPQEATVTAGPEYAAGGVRTFWLGKGYRDLWTTPVTVPVLDLETFEGGLKPLRRVGRLQTLGLGFEGKAGRQYTFRSLDKEPERILPVEWRDAFPAKIVRDHTSATYPTAALVLPVLAEALSLLHTEPRLVVLPDDPALGEFRKDFAGRLRTLDFYPDAGPGMPPPFDAATEVVKTNKLWERWLKGPKNGVAERAYLRARILDLLVGDYDRHSGQWRWVRLAGQPRWEVLREDPEMVFLKSEGLAFDFIRGRSPRFVKFGPEFPKRIEGLTASAAEMDRWLLSGLDRAAFEEVARDVQARLTDAVIDEAIARVPPEWREASRAAIVPALCSRRDALVPLVLHYYRDLAWRGGRPRDRPRRGRHAAEARRRRARGRGRGGGGPRALLQEDVRPRRNPRGACLRPSGERPRSTTLAPGAPRPGRARGSSTSCPGAARTGAGRGSGRSRTTRSPGSAPATTATGRRRTAR